MSKIVGFDGLNLAISRGTGIATYTRVATRIAGDLGYDTGILFSTFRDPPKDPVLREVTFFDDREEPKALNMFRHARSLFDLATDATGVRAHEISLTGTVLTKPLASRWVDPKHVLTARDVFERARRYFAVTGRLLEIVPPRKIDLFHWTYPIPARVRGAANIYTIHDLIPLRLPYTTLDWKRYFLRSTQAILDKADHVVTVSEASKKDILTYFRADETRITNTYQAVYIPESVRRRTAEDVAADLRGVFSLESRGYFLFFGSLEPKKNLGRVIQAYLASGVELPLVVVVAQNWRSDEEVRLLAQEHVKKRKKIIQFDYMPTQLLMTLIQGARAVLFPSLYEGFGLPILEGMSLGTPVVTSRVSSMPEVAGDAALSVDPYDLDELRRAFAALAADGALCEDLARRGTAQAETFSWERYRERLGSLYAQFI